MPINLIFFLVSIIFSVLFLIGIGLLQIFLSKRENKWLGVVLPGANILSSIVGVLFLREIISRPYIIIGSIILFLASNIPTIVLMTIYLSCRKKIKKNKEIDKMNIQDL